MADNTASSIINLPDHFMVGSPASGHDFVQHSYGMYIRFEQKMETSSSNFFIADEAWRKSYKPLLATSLGHRQHGDPITVEGIKAGQASGNCEPEQLLKITRDYKDALVQTWQSDHQESTWEEFRDGEFGISAVAAFEESAGEFEYAIELSYEELIKSPQIGLTAIVHHLLPKESNPDVPSFGKIKRQLSVSAIDKVMDDSSIRNLRNGDYGYLESVGIYKQWITKEQADEVDEFVLNL